jgi:hypothetical protein
MENQEPVAAADFPYDFANGYYIFDTMFYGDNVLFQLSCDDVFTPIVSICVIDTIQNLTCSYQTFEFTPNGTSLKQKSKKKIKESFHLFAFSFFPFLPSQLAREGWL